MMVLLIESCWRSCLSRGEIISKAKVELVQKAFPLLLSQERAARPRGDWNDA